MNGNLGILSVYHRGYFDEGPPKKYVNGRVKSKPVDGDYLHLSSIWNYIEDMGYPVEQISMVYYKGPSEEFSEMRWVGDDGTVREMQAILKAEGEVEILIDHGCFFPVDPVPDEEEGENNLEVDGIGPIGPGTSNVGLEGDFSVAPSGPGLVYVDLEEPDDVVEPNYEEDGSEDGEVQGPPARDSPHMSAREIEDAALDDLDFDLEENVDSDLGSPAGSDVEQLEYVRRARETVRRCTGRNGGQGKRGRVVAEDPDDSEQSRRPRGKFYKTAKGAHQRDVAVEYDVVSNGSTDLGSDFEIENPGQLSYDAEEEDYLQPNNVERWFDANEKIPRFACGMRFKDKAQVKEGMANYAIHKCYAIYCHKGDNTMQRYKCRETCPWEIYAAIETNDRTWRIKTYSSKHNCWHEYNSRLATQYWLANYLSKRVKAHPFYKVKELLKELKNELSLEPHYDKVMRAKKIVLKQMVGNYKDEYAVVKGYAEYLKSVNPGNSVIVKVSRRTAAPGRPLSFDSMYFCFNAIKSGWKKGCRPIIGLDGCHLKGICKGVLLVAVGRDANEHVYPIAWKVVDVESYDTWAGFISQLAIDLDMKDGKGITIVSDRHKGLLKARANILPAAKHRHCSRHLYANWGKRHKGTDLRGLFWRCVNATFKQSLKKEMDYLRTKTEAGYQELMGLDGHNWTKARFNSTSKCDVPHNNIAESFNGLILDARCLPIISMSEWIYNWCLEKRGVLLNKASKWKSDYAPKAMQRVKVNSVLARHCSIVPDGQHCYRVHDSLGDWGHSIDMAAHKCSCRYWQLNGIPCQHALACTKNYGVQPTDLISEYYSKEKYIKTYEDKLECTRGTEMWTSYAGDKVEAPVMQCKPGRPRVNRFKCRDEIRRVSKHKTVLSRAKRIMHCSICRSEKHTIKKCPNK